MAQEDSIAPRHGRHSAAGRHAAPRVSEAEQAGVPVADSPEPVEAPPADPTPASAEIPTSAAPVSAAPIPDLVTITDGDQETSMGDAPRPIGVNPQETGSFRRLEATEGARLTTRANASDTASFVAQKARPVEAVRMSTAGRPKVEHRDVAVESNKRVFLVLGIAALAMVAIVGWLLTKALTSVEEVQEHPITEQTQAAVEEGIEYRGTTYTVVGRDGGTYALVSVSEGSEEQAVLYELPGTPVSLILYNTVFIIPENLPDNTWDLIAHPLGGGSVTQQVTDADGNPIVGEGEISEATLSGDTIQIATTSGESFDVSLI